MQGNYICDGSALLRHQTEKEDTADMCKALEELEERGREKGRIEGRVEGAIKIYKKMEASREDTIKNIMEDFSLDKEVADKYVEEYY